MAIQVENYANKTAMELHKIQLVYISDYKQVAEELDTTGAEYRSGQSNSAPLIAKIKRLARRKVGILEDINALGRLIDERDGTLAHLQ